MANEFELNFVTVSAEKQSVCPQASVNSSAEQNKKMGYEME